MSMTFVKLAGLAFAVLIAGCTASSHKPPFATTVPTSMAAKATITGILEAVGGPAGTANRPLSGNVTATGNGHSYSVSVGTDGRYSISVPAGTYTVVGRSPQYQGGTTDCHLADPVTASSGGTATADVMCEEM
jgi:FlaG/FlaF family flagellin (archaellin)